MNTYSNPQLEWRNYNKMNANVGGDDGDAEIDDGDDAQSS
jgi:hypothetical protein